MKLTRSNYWFHMEPKMLHDLGFNLSLDRMNMWFRHQLYRVCPVKDCEWCRKERVK
jgi:hypothetical protein